MDRTVLYTGEALRDYDVSHLARDVIKGFSRLAQDLLTAEPLAPGSAVPTPPTLVAGLIASQSGTPDLRINFSEGWIYQLAVLDATQYGSLSGSADQSEAALSVMQQGRYAGGFLTLAPPAGAGQWQWNLVEGQFQQQDVVRNGDPSSGVLPYYNSANPAIPLAGPAGAGTVQNTVRLGAFVLQVKTGATAGSAGAAVAPTADSGWVPLYYTLLQNGQTQITNANIVIAGSSQTSNTGTTGTNIPAAPFIRGVRGRSALANGNITTDGAGNSTIVSSVGIASITLSATVMTINLTEPMNVTGGGTVLGRVIATATGYQLITVGFTNPRQIAVQFLNPNTGAVINPQTTALGVHVDVVSHQ